MSLAESAILLGFHSVRMGLLILRHVVITLFAFRTCQCNSCAHDFHLHFQFRCCVGLLLLDKIILSIKKRPIFFHSPVYYTIYIRIRQWVFAILCPSSYEKGQCINFSDPHGFQHMGTCLQRASCCIDIIYQQNRLCSGQDFSRLKSPAQIL